MKLLNIFTGIIKHPLNKGHKIKGLLRFLSWQIGTRILKKPVVVDYVNDARLVVKRSMEAATGNIYYGLMEFSEMSFVLHFLQRGDLMIDIGANIGSYSIIAGSLGANCISFEPILKTFMCLQDNIAINSYQDRIQCHNIGLGDINGTLLFTNNLGSNNRVAESGDVSTSQVKVCKLDDIVGNSNPIVIKLDVEGFEDNVLKGAVDTLGKKSLLAIIIETFGSTKYDSLMSGYGFKPYTYAPFDRKLIPLINGHSQKVSNTIYIKRVGEVEDRVINAAKFKILDKEI